MKLSVIIPAYNEESRIPATLEAAAGCLEGRCSYEIVVVDDGSTDGTAEVCRSFFKKNPCGRVLENPRNRGKGCSVRRGMMSAEGEYCLFSDADMSTPIEEVEKLLAAADEGFDIAIGSRGLPGSDIRVHQPLLRESMGKCFNLLVRLLAVRGIRDTQCGFKLFKRECARDVFGRSRLDGFSFDVEALMVARLLGYSIKEVPVVWNNSPASRVSVVRDPLRMFGDLFLIRYYAMTGRYV